MVFWHVNPQLYWLYRRVSRQTDNLSIRPVVSENTAFLPVSQLWDDEVLAIFMI